MFQKLKQKITATLGTSMETISNEDIEHAILVSNLTGQPTHIQGDWFVWYDIVLTKRMLLLILVVGYEQEVNVGFAAIKVLDHYRHVMHQLPAKYRIGNSIADSKKVATEIINDVWLQIQRKLPKENNNYSSYQPNVPWLNYPVVKLPRLDESKLQELIVNTWSQEYD